jgi:hypothetical protein
VHDIFAGHPKPPNLSKTPLTPAKAEA